MAVDQALRRFCTDRQWEVLTAIDECGSQNKAAIKLGVSRRSVRDSHAAVKSKAARHGHAPEHDMVRQVPDGFHVRGVSTLYDEVGTPRMQWVKSSIDHARQDEMFRAALDAMAEDLPRVKPTVAPKKTSDQLMACYPVGDHHLGMLSWAEETGADYDLSIGEQLLANATDHLIKSIPPCDAAAIVVLGDFMHYDSFESVTPTSRNQLDADSRFPKMVRAAIRSLRRMVQAALLQHGSVLLIIEIGNHDISSSIFLMECLSAIYEKEPRVKVDTSPRHFHYFRFGKNLVGVTHGDNTKMDRLPLIMAADRPEDWGQTTYRYWWTGHVHHDAVKDYEGCRAESFRILAPTDAWAANKGYRSGRDMKAIVLHKEYGEVARHIVNPAMVVT